MRICFRDFFFFFFELSYSHTKREDNKVAHYLAELAANFPDNVIWMENVAPSIFSFVQPDLASFFSIKLIVFSKKKKDAFTKTAKPTCLPPLFRSRKSIPYRRLYRFGQKYDIFRIPVNTDEPFRIYRYK